MTENWVSFLEYLSSQKSLKDGSVLKTYLWMSLLICDRSKLPKFFFWGEFRPKPWCNWSKNTLKDYAEVNAQFLNEWKTYIVRICLIGKVTSIGTFCVLNHFLDTFASWDIKKRNLTFGQSLIFNVFSKYFQIWIPWKH